MRQQENFEDDWGEYREEYREEIIGYYCSACGHVQDDNDWGGECERCTSHSLEPIYE